MVSSDYEETALILPLFDEKSAKRFFTSPLKPPDLLIRQAWRELLAAYSGYPKNLFCPGNMKHTPLDILVTGGTGLLGQALIPVLEAEGHSISVLTRYPKKYPPVSYRPGLFATLAEIPNEHPVDAVINLAGARIIGRRWTQGRKRILRDSRIDLTRKLVEWMARRQIPPVVMLSASATGYYGNRHDDILTEDAPCGRDFGAQLCEEWEREAISATALGTRVVIVRTGLVLSKKGGMLSPLLMSFRFGLGARIGSGNQWMSWIHIDDQVSAMAWLLHSENAAGAYNLSAPHPVTNADFGNCLARELRRPRFFTAPAPLLRAAMGEASALLLGGQRVVPAKLHEQGFKFRYPSLQGAIRSITGH